MQFTQSSSTFDRDTFANEKDNDRISFGYNDAIHSRRLPLLPITIATASLLQEMKSFEPSRKLGEKDACRTRRVAATMMKKKIMSVNMKQRFQTVKKTSHPNLEKVGGL